MLKKLSLSFCALLLLFNKVHAAKPVNILFAVADDMSHASAYGYKFLNTPNFDSIGEQGIRFNRMYTPSSKCSPSRAVILTGRNPWQLEELANHKPTWPEKYISVIEVLEQNGYFTGFTGKGWNPGIHPKNRTLTGRQYNQIKMDKTPTSKMFTSDYTANFKKFMQDKPKNQPFFFWYGAKEPHRGYEYKSGVRLGKKLENLDFTPSFWGGSEASKHDVLDYAIEVEYFDNHLGKILDHIKSIGELDNTIVIVTSDNAMPFPRYKGHPHEFATRVPFVVAWPGKIVNPGREENHFASFIDLAPTFLDIANIDINKTKMLPFEGKSLTDIFAAKITGRNTVLTGRERNDMARPNGWSYPVRSLHKGEFVYMHNFKPERWPVGTWEAGLKDTDGSPTKSDLMFNQKGSKAYALSFGKRPQEELYNIVKDPECINNLAEDPQYAAVKQSMQQDLFSQLKQQQDPRVLGNGDIFDQYHPYRQKEYAENVQKMADILKRRGLQK
ncbi:sulfatase [Paraglaciecola sp. L3A3]|uniref:sulfatase family protein n=1 Tax=Paraglaciecola sp. L3A3 TaxID=2686358 RepID=UPI00131BA527|nr:sulfatase [Paraglaciecola sp. L3A3]